MSATLAARDPRACPAPPIRISRRPPALVLGLATLAGLALCGCSNRESIHYNRWAPTNGRPTALRRAQWIRDAPERALNNLDERIEHTVY